MKKIYFSLMLLATLLVSSCSMDTKPFGELDDQTAIRDKKDLEQFRTSLYTRFRGSTSGGWLYKQDLIADEFIGVIGNGNRNGQIASGDIKASDSDMSGFWSSCYGGVASANKIMEGADKLLAGNVSDADKVEIGRYRAEASFARAYYFFFLADHFSVSYTQTDPEAAHSGIPLQVVYNPSGNIAVYPDRSTLAETYKRIEDDLADAYNGLKAYEASGAADVQALLAPNSAYLSSYAVECMQARVALVKGDWATALAKAKDVIESGHYALTTIADYAKLWGNDEGTEVIWRPFMSSTEQGSSVGGAYISANNQTCDYLPTFATLTMYDDEGDVRFDTFFGVNQTLIVEGSQHTCYQFQKFPGNSTLNSGSTNQLLNMCKPFRLSEMYLIAAEASARTNVDGSQYMNTFLANRIDGYEPGTYSASALLTLALKQRELEFIGEGFRLSDLRRLGQGFSRTADFPDSWKLNSVILTKSTVTYGAGDYRYTWPIPQSELDSNPQLKTQQNKGY